MPEHSRPVRAKLFKVNQVPGKGDCFFLACLNSLEHEYNIEIKKKSKDELVNQILIDKYNDYKKFLANAKKQNFPKYISHADKDKRTAEQQEKKFAH